MKIRRQKKVQRSLTFFRNNFGFHAPYQVILDGTFCQAALKYRVNIQDQVPRYLGDEANFMTTACAINETELLGPALHGAMLVVKKFRVTSCGHEKKPISAAQCLLGLLSSTNNKQHFILATQDKNLMQTVRQIPGCPILTLVMSALIMEKPSPASNAAASDLLEESSLKQVSDLLPLKDTTEVETKKRKRPKGPNPLSCKKKKVEKKTGDSKPELDAQKRRRKKRVKPKVPKHVKELLDAN